jgi:hypothetical protein
VGTFTAVAYVIAVVMLPDEPAERAFMQVISVTGGRHGMVFFESSDGIPLIE